MLVRTYLLVFRTWAVVSDAFNCPNGGRSQSFVVYTFNVAVLIYNAEVARGVGHVNGH